MKVFMIPADNFGNKLFLKDLKENGDRKFLKYRSTYNDMPFIETEIYPADEGKNCVITGEDSTVLWRFPINILNKLNDNEKDKES